MNIESPYRKIILTVLLTVLSAAVGISHRWLLSFDGRELIFDGWSVWYLIWLIILTTILGGLLLNIWSVEHQVSTGWLVAALVLSVIIVAATKFGQADGFGQISAAIAGIFHPSPAAAATPPPPFDPGCDASNPSSAIQCAASLLGNMMPCQAIIGIALLIGVAQAIMKSFKDSQ